MVEEPEAPEDGGWQECREAQKMMVIANQGKLGSKKIQR